MKKHGFAFQQEMFSSRKSFNNVKTSIARLSWNCSE